MTDTPKVSELFAAEAFMRASATTAEFLMLDEILCDRELGEGERIVKAHAHIQSIAQGEDK